MTEGVCPHLAPLYRALRRGGYQDLAYTEEGWGRGMDGWHYFHCCFELSRVSQRFDMPPSVEVHREIDAHWGAWLGYECKKCNSAVLGRHPARSQSAPNYPGTGQPPKAQYVNVAPPDDLPDWGAALETGPPVAGPPSVVTDEQKSLGPLTSDRRIEEERTGLRRSLLRSLFVWGGLTAAGIAVATFSRDTAGGIVFGLIIAAAGAWLGLRVWRDTRLALWLLDGVEPEIGIVSVARNPAPSGDGDRWTGIVHLGSAKSASGRRGLSPWNVVLSPVTWTLDVPLGQTLRARIYLHPEDAVPLMLAVEDGLLLVDQIES